MTNWFVAAKQGWDTVDGIFMSPEDQAERAALKERAVVFVTAQVAASMSNEDLAAFVLSSEENALKEATASALANQKAAEALQAQKDAEDAAEAALLEKQRLADRAASDAQLAKQQAELDKAAKDKLLKATNNDGDKLSAYYDIDDNNPNYWDAASKKTYEDGVKAAEKAAADDKLKATNKDGDRLSAYDDIDDNNPNYWDAASKKTYDDKVKAETAAAAGRKKTYDELGLTFADAPNNSGGTGNETEIFWLLEQAQLFNTDNDSDGQSALVDIDDNNPNYWDAATKKTYDDEVKALQRKAVYDSMGLTFADAPNNLGGTGSAAETTWLNEQIKLFKTDRDKDGLSAFEGDLDDNNPNYWDAASKKTYDDKVNRQKIYDELGLTFADAPTGVGGTGSEAEGVWLGEQIKLFNTDEDNDGHSALVDINDRNNEYWDAASEKTYRAKQKVEIAENLQKVYDSLGLTFADAPNNLVGGTGSQAEEVWLREQIKKKDDAETRQASYSSASSSLIPIGSLPNLPEGFEYVRSGGKFTDSDWDKVLVNSAGMPVVRRAGVHAVPDPDVELGWMRTQPGGQGSTSSSGANLHTNEVRFDTGIPTNTKKLFQGYSLPLTEDELLEGYQSIIATGTWTDPRWERHTDLSASDVPYVVDGEESSQWNFPNQLQGGDDTGKHLAYIYHRTYYGGNNDVNYAVLDGKDKKFLGDLFLAEYTVGRAYAPYAPSDSLGQEFEVMLGRDPDGSAISLYQVFDTRVPVMADGNRLDASLPASYIEGVHTDLTVSQIGDLYMDIALRNGYAVADEIMAALPDHLAKKWDARFDSGDPYGKGAKFQAYGADPQMQQVLGLKLTRDIILESPQGILGIDPDILPALMGDQNLTVDGGGNWSSSDKGLAKEYLLHLSDALKAYQANPDQMTWQQRDAVHRLKLAEAPLLMGEVGDSTVADVESATSNAVLDEIADWYNHQALMNNWESRSDEYPAVVDAVEATRPNESDNYTYSDDDYYYGSTKSDTYGQSMLNSLGTDSTGQNYNPGMNYIVTNAGGQLINGLTSDPVQSGTNYDAAVVTWGMYTTEWQKGLLEAQLPMYQETEEMGFSLEDRDRYYNLRDGQNVALKEPPISVEEFAKESGVTKPQRGEDHSRYNAFINDPKNSVEAREKRTAKEKELYELHQQLNGARIEFTPEQLNGNEAYGEDESHYLWFDPTRLYMKLPSQDTNQDFISNGQDGVGGRGFQIENQSFQHNSHNQKFFEGEVPNYDYFAVGNDELTLPGIGGEYTQKQNKGEGWFYDISGGDAPVGAYTMVWVEQPVYWERPPSDPLWNNPFVQLLASINPVVNIAFQAFRAAMGETLKLNDYLSVAQSAAKLNGNLKKPSTPAEANKAGEAARSTAEAEAIAEGFTGQTVIQMGDAAYNTAYQTAISDIGFGSLNYKQTTTVLKAIGAGDDNDAIGILLGGFGQEYFETGLQALGLDTTKLDDELMEDVFKVTTDVANGKPFEQAAAGPVGKRVLDLFGSDSKAYNTAKDFVSGLVGDLKDGLKSITDIGDSDFLDDFKPIIEALKDLDEKTNFSAILQQSSSLLTSSFKNVETALKKPLDNINEMVFEPLTDTVKAGLSKFTNISAIPGVTDGFEESVEKFVESIGEATKVTWDNLDDGLKKSVEESIGLELLADGDTTVQQRQNIFTKHLVTADAVSKIDSDITDTIGVPILTASIRNAVTAAIGDGPAPGRVFLDSVADYSVAAVKKLVADGDGEEFVDAIKDFGTKITGEYGKTVDIRKELDALVKKKADLIKTKQEYDASKEAMDAERGRLYRLATEPGATEQDVINYTQFQEMYTANEPELVGSINSLILEINGIDDAYDDKAVLYSAAMADLAYNTQLYDERLQKEYDDLYTGTLIELTKGELGLDFDIAAYRGLYGLSPTKTSVEDVAKHFINNLSAGNPVTQEQYGAEYAAEATKFLTTIYTEMGVNVAKLDPETLQDFTKRILSKAIGTIGSDGSGGTALDALKERNKSLEETGRLVFLGDEIDIDQFFRRDQGALGENGRPIDFDELKADESFSNIGNYVNELIATAGDDWDKVLSGEIDFSISPTGEINWGADGHKQSMWSDSEQKFVTYQYNASGSERYKLNDDGTAPAEAVKVYESTGMLTDLTTFIGPDPTTYAAVLGNLEDEQALALEIDRLEREYPDSEELAGLKSLQTAVDNGYTPKEEEMPWGLRAAKMWMDGAVTLSTNAEEALLESGLLDKVGPLTVGEEIELARLEDKVDRTEKNIELQANYVVGVPSLLNQWGESTLNALTTFFKQLPAQSASNDQFVAAMKSGKTVAEASALADKVYNETTLATEDDWRSIVDNDAITLHKSVEALAHNYMTPEFLADETEMLANLNAAEGVVGNAKAIFGELYDKPNVFLAHLLGDELIPEVLTLGFGSIVGKSVAKAVSVSVGKELAEKIGVKAAMGTSAVLDAAEIYADTTIGTYDLVLSELTRTGYEGDIDAKAQEIAVRAGMQGLFIAASTAKFGGAALDSKILSKGSKEVLGTFAEKIDDFATVVTKETLTEAIQEAYVAGFTEVALYNEGVTDRDATGEVAAAATMGALAGGSTTAIIAGFSAQPPLFSNSNTGPAGSGNVFSDMILANAQYQGMDKAQTREYLEAFGVLEGTGVIGNSGAGESGEITAPSTPALEGLYSGVREGEFVGHSPNDVKVLAIELGRPISLNTAQELVDAGNDRDAPWVANKSDEELSTYELKDVVNAFLEYTYGDAYIDTDGDGVKNNADLFPNDATETIDTDNDGVGDNADVYAEDGRYTTEQQYQDAQDSDGDGVANAIDAFPNDATETADSDNDGVGDNLDVFPNDASETTDSDNDGVGDNADELPNNQMFSTQADFDEWNATSPEGDADGDQRDNILDAFPNDASEWEDSDNDGVGDNADAFPNDASETLDSDNDSVGDNADAFPNDATETTDSDNDGVGDNADELPNNQMFSTQADFDEWNATSPEGDADGDGVANAIDPRANDPSVDDKESFDAWYAVQDDDNDDVLNEDDAFPLRADESVDTDQDGLGDNEDTDDDGDDVEDGLDAFPLRADESVDTDGDGLGNNEDTDDDGDDVEDGLDAFPLDAAETLDFDNDGTGDNADTDDDNDGTLDALDAFPLNADEALDFDNDGVGDNADTDDDGDGTLDTEDAFPLDAAETTDSDSDSVGDNADPRPNDQFVYDDATLEAWNAQDLDEDGVINADDAFPENPDETGDGDGDGVGDNVDDDDLTRLGKYALVADINGDGTVDALTDGILLLRHAFGLSGEELITGVITDESVRNTAKEIEEYLADERVQALIDVTNDGKVDALTDGIGLLRMLFGLEGDGITDGLGLTPDQLADTMDKMLLATHSVFSLDSEGVPTEDIKTLPLPDTLKAPAGRDIAAEAELDELEAVNYKEAIPEIQDYRLDSDDDGTIDEFDAFPLDASETTDSDNDGVGDNLDAFPEDATETLDTDNDGVGDEADAFPNDASETLDTDNDGVGDEADAFPNDASETLDTDNDGVGDNLDAFPNDATETLDTDNDGVGDNLDAFPNDPNETLDTDNDGVGDEADAFPNDASETLDTDNDGVGDEADAFPNDATETLDTDNDGVGDNLDAFPNDATETLDTDNDGVGDEADAFPLDASETLDTDNDGVGDNLDAFPNDPNETLDTDNDGVGDEADAFPNDASETLDTDNDGVGDEADAFPNDATETLDTDNDGVGDNLDAFPNDDTETTDSDNDGVGDNLDAFPNDATETLDTDNDGTGDNADIRPTDPDVFDEAGYEAGLDTKDATIAELESAAEVTAEILGIEANLVTEEDIALVTDYLAGVELAQDKVDNITRYDVTGQDDLVTQEDLDLLTNAYTLGDYTGFDPDADFNPATGMYKTVAEKEAEIAAQNQAAIDAQVQYELDKQQALEQQQEESDTAKQDALTQLETDIRTEIETDINTEIETEIKTEAEEQEEKFRRQLVAPGRRGEITTPDPAIIQYEYDISGDSIFATPDQETGYIEQGPYAPRANEQSPYGGSLKSPYGASLTSKIQDRLQGQQGLASGGTVKDKTDEILRILGER